MVKAASFLLKLEIRNAVIVHDAPAPLVIYHPFINVAISRRKFISLLKVLLSYTNMVRVK